MYRGIPVRIKYPQQKYFTRDERIIFRFETHICYETYTMSIR